MNDMNKLIAKIVAGIVAIGISIFLISNMTTTVAADEIVVKQDFFGGHLSVWDQPGVHWQNFGHVTRYKKSAQYWFSKKKDEGKEEDDSIKVRFNDGAHGQVSGSLRYNLPTDPNKMITLHTTYGSMAAVDHELIRQVVNKSVYMTGPLMSSRESYAEKRADMINYMTDQIVNGVYRTERKQMETTDPLSGQKKTIDYVEPKVSPTSPNGIDREEESPVLKFGLTAYNITINGIDYDPEVENQIKQQQVAIQSVQQAIVNSRKAEQDALTVAKQGEANSAKAKWDQEVIKATEITKAEQEKAVALLNSTKEKEVAALQLETAKLAAQKTITEAKADADSTRLKMQANNYFQERLDAYKEISIAQANALGAQRQTPDVVMGGNSGNSSSTTQALMDIMATKAARDLGVNPKP